MVDIGTLVYEQAFTNTDMVQVSHNLNERQMGYQIIIDGLVRNDLVISDDLDEGDPLNRFNLGLVSPQTGTVQVFASNLRYVTLPSIETYRSLTSEQRAEIHLLGGDAELDADKLNLSVVLEHTTSDTSPENVSNVNHLGAVIKGIDSALGILENKAPKTHAISHQDGGSDEIATLAASPGGIPKANALGFLNDSWISPSNVTQHVSNINHNALEGVISNQHLDHSQLQITVGPGLQGGGDLTASRAIALDVGNLTEKLLIDTNQDFVIVYDSDSDVYRKAKILNLTLGNSTSVFGQGYQTVTSLVRSTTTSSNFQTKVQLTTLALTGIYRVGWSAVVDCNRTSDAVQVRLQNVTDNITVGVIQEYEPKDANNRISAGGFGEVVFTGLPKSFSIQYREQRGGTAGIQDARIELWRVS